MMKVTFNGRPFRKGDFEKALMDQALAAVKDEMRNRIGSIRRSDTGEFPTVRVLGDTLDDIRMHIESSPELLEWINERLNDEERKATIFMPTEHIGSPKAFLSFSFADQHLARQIANALMANGIDTWWADWELQAGDSLRQKIDGGLGTCTHFLVLLTPGSLVKPWVQQEMDAGLVRKIEGKARFIPLRAGLAPSELPPLLSGMLSPEIGTDFETSIRNLVNDIHAVSRKPRLGPPPAHISLPQTGYSKTATAVARLFVEETEHGEFGQPQKEVSELAEAIGVSEEDITDAVYELRDLVKEWSGTIVPKAELFAAFDEHFMEWSPEQDALRLAADLVNDETMPGSVQEIAARYGWPPRRINPAVTWLENRTLIRSSKAMGTQPWIAAWIDKTDATRRFVKSRS
jgi:hypothetical protein